MHSRRLVLLLAPLTLLLVAGSAIQCGKAASGLVGTWENSSGGLGPTKITINQDGTCITEHGTVPYRLIWEAQGDELTLNGSGGQTTKMKFVVKGDTLVLRDAHHENSYKRAGK